MFFSLPTDLEIAGNQWITESRNRHRVLGKPLDVYTRRHLQPYFGRKTLDNIRIHTVSRISDPPFLKNIAESGIADAFDFRFAAGITFIDTIVLARELIGHMDMTVLVFHEAVHVAQYRCLGLKRFIRHYIHGLTAHRSYHRIPIEAQAYRLQQRFETESAVFSVEDEILRHFSNT